MAMAISPASSERASVASAPSSSYGPSFHYPLRAPTFVPTPPPGAGTVVQPMFIQSNVVQPMVVQQAVVQLAVVQPTVVQPTMVQPTFVQQQRQVPVVDKPVVRDVVVEREVPIDRTVPHMLRSERVMNAKDLPGGGTLSPDRMMEDLNTPGAAGLKGIKLSSFFYHDPALGCNVRRHQPNRDHLDHELRNLRPDQKPPLELLLRTAYRDEQRKEKQDKWRAKFERTEAPHAFHHDPTTNLGPASVCILPDDEYHGIAWWLS